jgi:hypothetical protein
MLKTPRRRDVPSRSLSLSRKRTLHLASETVRMLTEEDLVPVVGGSVCPNGSYPTGEADSGTC